MRTVMLRMVACTSLVCLGGLGVNYETSAALSEGIPGGLVKRLEAALANGDNASLIDALAELSQFPAAEAARYVLEVAAVSLDDKVFERALETLGGYGNSALDPLFVELLAQRKLKPMLLAVVLTYAGRQSDAISEQWVLTGLVHPAELVQRNAIDAAVARRSKRSIDVLLDVLEKEGIDVGLIGYDAHVALVNLTGVDFDNIEDWRNYWSANRESFDPAKVGADAGKTAIPRKQIDTPTFFGLEIISRRVTFVVDISGSMTMYDEGGEEGGGKSDRRVRERMARTRRELANAISKLDGRAFFNVIAFNNAVHPFMKSLVSASEANKGKALNFVRKLAADNATHTDEALRRAFDDTSVDTIILLSDGAPMKSQNEGPEQLIPRILSDVKQLNRLRRVRIFTLGFEGQGQWPPGSKYAGQPPVDAAQMVSFLKQLAAENRGTYKAID
ncbi:MAG: hypothetical protein ACKVX7_10780 [Planctomycetota bacterium]